MREAFERNVAILSVAIAAGSGLACSEQSDPTPATTPTTIEQDSLVYPECDPIAGALINFTYNESTFEGGHDDSLSDILYWVEAHPDLAPQALVDTYIADWEAQSTSTGLQFVFEEGVIPEAWGIENESPIDLPNADQQILAGKVDNLLRVLNEYPRELFETIGVTSVRVAEQYESYRGHFDDTADEILVEFDAFSNGGASLDALRLTVAHEVFGHAAHSSYCEGLIEADRQISEKNEDFDYLGYPQDGTSPEQLEQFYAQVPDELLVYGPERMFARAYGASSVAEDVATIVEFTLEQRGLIRDGDKDFGSPLQQKQQEIVGRMEEMLPGFRIFAEQHTDLLRTDPLNEVNIDHEHTLVVPPELAPDAATYNPETEHDFDFASGDTVNVLNGAIYYPHEKERGGTLGYYPIVNINPSAEITGISLRSDTVGWLTDPLAPDEELRFYDGDLGETSIVQMTFAEWEELVEGAYDWNVSPTDPNTFLAAKPQPYVYARAVSD